MKISSIPEELAQVLDAENNFVVRKVFNGFYPDTTDGFKTAEIIKSCFATLRRIRGL